MSHPNKAKGTRWESEVARFLDLERLGSIHGKNDQGDLRHLQWVIECKDEQKINLAGYMDEAILEAVNAGKSLTVAVVKRRRRSVEDAYAVMPLWVFRAVMEYLEG